MGLQCREWLIEDNKRNGTEETWKEGKKVRREQGKKWTLYTGEPDEKEFLPKGETCGPEATLSVSQLVGWQSAPNLKNGSNDFLAFLHEVRAL